MNARREHIQTIPDPGGQETPSAGRRQAFTLIQLIVVLAIISIVAALSSANILSTRKSANETSAVASLRTIFTANQVYKTRFGEYAGSLRDLGRRSLIDKVLETGMKAGYDFEYVRDGFAWSCQANPMVPGTSGDQFFYVGQPGVTRVNQDGPATESDPPFNPAEGGGGGGRKGQGKAKTQGKAKGHE